MSENDGTFSKLMELADTTPVPKPVPVAKRESPSTAAPVEQPASTMEAPEDINETPYISQNYRFTEEELRWLRKRSFDLTEQVGAKVSQNTILRIALRELRQSCDRNPNSNPLSKAVARLKK